MGMRAVGLLIWISVVPPASSRSSAHLPAERDISQPCSASGQPGKDLAHESGDTEIPRTPRKERSIGMTELTVSFLAKAARNRAPRSFFFPKTSSKKRRRLLCAPVAKRWNSLVGKAQFIQINCVG